MEYKYRKRAGALNQINADEDTFPSSLTQNISSLNQKKVRGPITGVFELPPEQLQAQLQVQAQSARSHRMGGSAHLREQAANRPTHSRSSDSGIDNSSRNAGKRSMFFYTVKEGHKALMITSGGAMEVLVGPIKIWAWGRRFKPMAHYIAHPGEFLIIRFRDGTQEHIEGPCDLWFDPRLHSKVEKEEALQLANKEAVVVYYDKNQEEGAKADTDTKPNAKREKDLQRRIVHGPAVFVPRPGEWLHTFSWHGSAGSDQGYAKIPNALVFEKLWLMPDQMYHNLEGVRTADDAVLTIRLMLFFELTNIEKMLETTHDPIGDFVNAATSDVVAFTSARNFTTFKQETSLLNERATYRQLMERAEQCGYHLDKVVYRGYDAPPKLQQMHDQAIESRTRLLLQKETERQSEDLQDNKLERELKRAARNREEALIKQVHEQKLSRDRQEQKLHRDQIQQHFEREQLTADAKLQNEMQTQENTKTQAHLAALKGMGVNLTQYLTQGRADRVIEVRGGESTHLHLPSNKG